MKNSAYHTIHQNIIQYEKYNKSVFTVWNSLILSSEATNDEMSLKLLVIVFSISMLALSVHLLDDNRF